MAQRGETALGVSDACIWSQNLIDAGRVKRHSRGVATTAQRSPSARAGDRRRGETQRVRRRRRRGMTDAGDDGRRRAWIPGPWSSLFWRVFITNALVLGFAFAAL